MAFNAPLHYSSFLLFEKFERTIGSVSWRISDVVNRPS